MARQALTFSLVVSVIALTVAVHARIPSEPHSLTAGDTFVPSPAHAKLAALGFDAVVADYHWLQAVQVVGSSTGDPTTRARHLGRLIDVVTSLDPWVDHPYRFAAVWMVDSEESVRTANRFLEQATRVHPTDWRQFFYLGFNHFFYLQENDVAADWLEQGMALPGAPRYLPRLVARLRAQEGADLASASVFLEEMVRRATDEGSRAAYQKALDEIQIERVAQALDRARASYRELAGRDIEQIEDLMMGPHAVLSSLPPAVPASLPTSLRRDARWTLDEDSDQIVSSYYGHRYQVVFHPLTKQQHEEWSAAK